MGVKDNSGEGLERKDSCREINCCMFLENAYSIMNRMLLETGTYRSF